MSEANQLVFPGIDGANPLGFLAGLGTWRTTDQLYPGVRMAWTLHAGHWSPMLEFFETVPENLIKSLYDLLREMHGKDVFTFSNNLKVSPNEFRATGLRTLARQDDIQCSFLSAFGSDATLNDQGDIQDTAFRTMSGAGHQHFLKTMNDLAGITTQEQLQKTLFNAWNYSEEKIGLRWDPSEDKRYALAWKNPSQEVTMTQRGANRLAIEALPLFPTAPVGHYLETTGFIGHKSNDTYWTWPIWEAPINIDTGRSLLSLRELTLSKPSPANLQPRGVLAVYRSQRITTGKFRNFTPAVQIA